MEAKMDRLGPSPFCWLEFDEKGGLVDAGAPAAITAMLNAPGVNDVVVMSHGWKNTKSDATTLYGTLWGNAATALGHLDPAKIGIVGIVWPAAQFTTDFDNAAAAGAAGGTRSVGDGEQAGDLSSAAFEAKLNEIRDLFGADADGIIEASREAADGITFETANALFKASRAAVVAPRTDPELAQNRAFFDPNDSPDVVLNSLQEPPSIKAAPQMGHVSGLGDAIGGLFNGARAAVGRVLNQLTYYEMKARAGIVGAALGGRVLPSLPLSPGKRLHLVGHSFGARLVTVAASALPARPPLQFFSLTLLQGAFSHNGFSADASGAFASVLGRPTGPISITHTHNDSACTFWYALASRLSNDATKGFGDADDIFGAMGANGAQKLKVGVSAIDNGGPPFQPQRGKVNGFLANGYIAEHNDVTNATCGRLLASVLES
jgi:hypothetical protein